MFACIFIQKYLAKIEVIIFSKRNLLSCAHCESLAVIVTRVPMFASEISKRRAGITINYSHEELAKAIIALLKDEKLLSTYKKNALAMAHDFTWDQIFELAITHTLKFCSL